MGWGCCCIRRWAGSNAGSACGHRSRRPCAPWSRLILFTRSKRLVGRGITGAGRGCRCDPVIGPSHLRQTLVTVWAGKARKYGGNQMKMKLRVLAVAGLVAAFATAAQAQNVRVRGTIESVDGNTVMVESREGASLKLVLKDNANVRGVVNASLADVTAST